jgi:murein DD-endopeptidase MepM/ murein hydrolase activator NlpD
MVSAAVLLALGLSAAQGEALALAVDDEPGVAAVAVEIEGRSLPLADRGERWTAVLGVDLDMEPGAHAFTVTYRYADGRARAEAGTLTVAAARFPTTELTVEPRYVDPDPADAARAAREAEEIAAVYAIVTPEPYWNEPFAAPIPGAENGRNFGHRRVFNGQPRAPHSGADLTAATGTPIRASNRGRVTLAKDLYYSGNAVFIDHGQGVHSTYLHLSRIDVAVGDIVEHGQVIGLAGATGRVTGPHLHWGVRVLDARVDPFSLLAVPTR